MRVDEKNPGKEWPQILAILIGCLLAFSSGMMIAWTSPFISQLTNNKEKYDITESQASLLSTLVAVGIMASAPITSIFNNRFGRKKCLLFTAPLQSVYFLVTIFGRHIYVLYAGRILGGVSDAFLYSNFAAYIGEISTPKIRGSWGNFPTVSISAGMFFINVLGSYCDIQQTGYISLLFPLLFFICFLWVPESPYFYIITGKHENAKKSLQWLLRKTDVDYEYSSIKEGVESQMQNSGKWKELFMVKSNRKALTVGTFLRLTQQMVGITVFESYAQYIFEKSGSNFSHQISAMIFYFLLWILSAICSFTLDKLGRKKSFLFSAIGCSICLGADTVYFYFFEYQQSKTFIDTLNWIPLTALALYLVFYSPGLAILPTLIMSELFPANIKEKGVCALNIVMGATVLLGTGLFHILSVSFGFTIPFGVFTVAGSIASVIGIFIIPDTQGKTLEEIQQQLTK